jgi:hypothetical protein
MMNAGMQATAKAIIALNTGSKPIKERKIASKTANVDNGPISLLSFFASFSAFSLLFLIMS